MERTEGDYKIENGVTEANYNTKIMVPWDYGVRSIELFTRHPPKEHFIFFQSRFSLRKSTVLPITEVQSKFIKLGYKPSPRLLFGAYGWWRVLLFADMEYFCHGDLNFMSTGAVGVWAKLAVPSVKR